MEVDLNCVSPPELADNVASVDADDCEVPTVDDPLDCCSTVSDVALVELRGAFVIGPIPTVRLDFVTAVGLVYAHFSFVTLPCEKSQLPTG